MPALPKWISTFRLLVIAGAWSSAMVVVGALALLEWPTRLGSWGPWGSLGSVGPWGKAGMFMGALLVAGGLYGFAFFAGRAFPLASPKAKAVFELLPWTALVALIAGGLAR